MDIHQVVMKALTDEDYAQQLKRVAEKAKEDGQGSPAHKKLLSMFGINEQQADQLHIVVGAIATITTSDKCPA